MLGAEQVLVLALVRIHPAATMLAVLAGGTLPGIIGALVAVPMATAVGLILEEPVFPARDASEPEEGLADKSGVLLKTWGSDRAPRPRPAPPRGTGS